MIFGNRLLRDITETDIRALVESGMAEHLQLEYKSAPYEKTGDGHREFLKDICMFANAIGGVLIVGITEIRGEDGKPSGVLDPGAELGVESANPENELLSYDSRIVACIQERLVVESHPVKISNGRFVMIFRIPNSLLKPHCVCKDGHVYFISRRDRHKYDMDIREIKEQTMRTASQMERAEVQLNRELNSHVPVGLPILLMAQVPIYTRDSLVNITNENIKSQIAAFDVFATDDRPNQRDYRDPTYGFSGLRRSASRYDVTLNRNGMLTMKAEFPGSQIDDAKNFWQFELARVDILVRGFAVRANEFYLAAGLDSPSLLGAHILTSMHLRAEWNYGQSHAQISPNEDRRFVFPAIEIGGPSEDVNRAVRPICDHIHQSFGLSKSNWFHADDSWHEPRR
jgi:hypothetical protein